MDAIAKQLSEKIRAKKAHVGIIGMGYVGLPLAVEFAKAGFMVTGLDQDAGRVQALLSGRSYIPDVPSTELQNLLSNGRFGATTDAAVLKDQDAILICVPTPLNKIKAPDLSCVVASVEAVRGHLRAGQLVVLESTTYPGTTDEVVLPKLEESGLKVGRDFFLAFSPERVDPGNKQFNTRNTPKIVGGITPDCTRLAQTLYGQTVEKVIPVSSTRTAETVKLLENTFRSVNIGLINEFALMCDKLGIDVWEVIEAAATKPFGFLPFYPGPGIGGHCIPVDPFYLSWKARHYGFEPRFIELAGQINGRMPEHVVEKLAEAMNDRSRCLKGAKVLVVGVAYKGDINDVRESPALDILSLLVRKGALVSYHDPYVPRLSMGEKEMASQDLTETMLESVDGAVIVTDHRGMDYSKLVKCSPLILDTRNALKGVKAPHIVRL